MFVSSVQIISSQDIWQKSVPDVYPIFRSPCWWSEKLHQYGDPILGSVNLSKTFRQGRDLKLEEVPSLFMSYKTTISWVYPRFLFARCVTVKTIYKDKTNLTKSYKGMFRNTDPSRETERFLISQFFEPFLDFFLIFFLFSFALKRSFHIQKIDWTENLHTDMTPFARGARDDG